MDMGQNKIGVDATHLEFSVGFDSCFCFEFFVSMKVTEYSVIRIPCLDKNVRIKTLYASTRHQNQLYI